MERAFRKLPPPAEPEFMVSGKGDALPSRQFTAKLTAAKLAEELGDLIRYEAAKKAPVKIEIPTALAQVTEAINKNPHATAIPKNKGVDGGHALENIYENIFDEVFVEPIQKTAPELRHPVEAVSASVSPSFPIQEKPENMGSSPPVVSTIQPLEPNLSLEALTLKKSLGISQRPTANRPKKPIDTVLHTTDFASNPLFQPNGHSLDVIEAAIAQELLVQEAKKKAPQPLMSGASMGVSPQGQVLVQNIVASSKAAHKAQIQSPSPKPIQDFGQKKSPALSAELSASFLLAEAARKNKLVTRSPSSSVFATLIAAIARGYAVVQRAFEPGGSLKEGTNKNQVEGAMELSGQMTPSLQAEKLAWIMLFIGILLFAAGFIRYRYDVKINDSSGVGQVTQEGHLPMSPLSPLSPLSSAYAFGESKNGQDSAFAVKSGTTSAIYKRPWTHFLEALQEKKHKIIRVKELHPRLQVVSLDQGLEASLLLSENDKTIDEVIVRVNLLEGRSALVAYQTLVTDLQEMVANGVMKNDPIFTQKLNLPPDLYTVKLPYNNEHHKNGVIGVLQIQEPSTMSLRLRAEAPSMASQSNLVQTK